MCGRLTKEVDLRETPNGKKVARFTMAVDRMKDGADFISCVAFEKTAEFIDKYFSKGSKILIAGRIQTGNYKDKDGKTVYTTDVIVESCEFAGAKNETEGTSNAPKTEKPTQAKMEDFMAIDDSMEGLPWA